MSSKVFLFVTSDAFVGRLIFECYSFSWGMSSRRAYSDSSSGLSADATKFILEECKTDPRTWDATILANYLLSKGVPCAITDLLVKEEVSGELLLGGAGLVVERLSKKLDKVASAGKIVLLQLKLDELTRCCQTYQVHLDLL
jgi:hypothetical protein